MKKTRLGIVLIVILAALFSATPAYADTPEPDSTPTVEEINVYGNLLETGDRLFLIHANIPYATTPDLPVTWTFIWVLLDPEGETMLGCTVGTAFQSSGYGYNVYGMYFPTTDNLSWELQYTVRLIGNPAAFDDPPIYNFTVNLADYASLEDDLAYNRAELAGRILNLAGDLDSKWGLATDNSLLVEQEMGTVLSIYGETFFRRAIYGIQALAPSAFSLVVRDIDITSREWEEEYTENLTGQWSGTWVETAQEGGKTLFGTDWDLLSVIILMAMCVGLLMGNVMLTGDAWNGVVDVSLIMVIGAKLGFFALGFLGLVAALMWIYIGIRIWRPTG